MYNVYDSNMLDINLNENNKEKCILVMERLIVSYKEIFKFFFFLRCERNVLRKCLLEDYVWKFGYSLQCENGDFGDVVLLMVKGIRYWLFNLNYWKIFLVILFKGVKGG